MEAPCIEHPPPKHNRTQLNGTSTQHAAAARLATASNSIHSCLLLKPVLPGAAAATGVRMPFLHIIICGKNLLRRKKPTSRKPGYLAGHWPRRRSGLTASDNQL